ncbi:hypothetical protein LR48_Vigan07g125100 [Vigna angularis]|uniref:Putative plant transposon protein domain-containing protein n=1 Tax=Phaseolus angularis TaxID=3914 RepID=A0A0L9UY90_PHAAN|nr:hypothetical protein LR48_Vigan07g125100 [Vigna angularis]
MERKVDQLPREAPQFAEEVWMRHWSKLTTYPEPANIAVVQEFYANARVYSEEEEPFMSYVRGKRVLFDVVIINSFLNNQWPEDSVRCQYVPSGHFQRNKQGQPLHIRRSFLTLVCKYWVAFIHASLSPCSHVSDLTTSRVVLLFFILQGKQINVGRLIAQEINDCAHSTNAKSPLGHPSLITHLCKLVGVDSSTPPFERPRKMIDRSYYMQYCLLDEEGLPIPSPQPPRPHRCPQSALPDLPDQPDPYHMFDMKLALIDAKLEAVNRIGLAQAKMMRQRQVITQISSTQRI